MEKNSPNYKEIIQILAQPSSTLGEEKKAGSIRALNDTEKDKCVT